jgi:hypothetical protein
MQLTLHPSGQEIATGQTAEYIEPNLRIRSLVVNVSAISVNLFGNITFKIQYSADGSNWFDVPNLATGNITATGSMIISLSEDFPTLDHIRLAWTFTNANSVTFTGIISGVK